MGVARPSREWKEAVFNGLDSCSITDRLWLASKQAKQFCRPVTVHIPVPVYVQRQKLPKTFREEGIVLRGNLTASMSRLVDYEK